MFDIDEILSKIYDFDSQDEQDYAIDVIIEFFWDAAAARDFEAMNLFYEKIDLSKITKGSIICSPVMNTFKYIPQIPNHLVYWEKAVERYRELGYDEDRIHSVMDRYQKVGDYWESMAQLGAPEWLAGKKPE
jgi:hypothetical protein